ncbi:phosphoribosyltransferase family protein [Muricauda sp. 334s03]|uniref:Phosphoribosyltransferase family protein n=1 Tax=Flagellimonas yonaguniensis TaxID=3031325 RepID=A0ABT5XX57_9FLAO|nr:phosphoribosyltransferase family protein [[Muricauda] yonaguniensis]MDF0715760.1 phosphoribosyltransferase family protein [[Muricauda] yonaguniensis]
MFKDRTDAGIQLAGKLQRFAKENVVVLAIPRGGLPLGAIVAKTLQAPLDVALSKKIGHPHNKEFAIGAVSLDDIILSNLPQIDASYIARETEHIRQKLRERFDQYHKNSSPLDLRDKTVIIVDDGVATGNTIKITAQMVHKKQPKKVVVAIPVAPIGAIKSMEASKYIDKVIFLESPYNFRAVGQFYNDFKEISDETAVELLETTRRGFNP